jgi:DNA-binding HxlR family transcriptional regulator
MLLEHLKELIEFKMVDKETFECYPLKVEYFLTKRGKSILEALTIMQQIGIELMMENGMQDVLKENGFID